MTDSKKLFGTDGIRGIANQFPMTTDIAMQVGRAIAFKVMGESTGTVLTPKGATGTVLTPKGATGTAMTSKKPKILIGKDTRLSGYMIEQALASGINSMGVDVLLVGPLPTPGIAFLTQNMRAAAGIVISASHNLFQDNGIKVFGRDGYKLPVTEEKKIEDLVFNGDLSHHLPTAELVGKSMRIDDAIGRYVVYVKNTFPKNLTLQGLKIVLDCANGAAYKVAPWVFEELGAEVIKLNVSPNGTNINDKCGALYPEGLFKTVIEMKADVGIGVDGDADRVILSDEKGRLINGDHVLAICAIDMDKKGELDNHTVVATQMSNVGLEHCLKKAGIKLLLTEVGDKYVVDAMKQGGYKLGGEQSGHIIFLDNGTTGDGLIAALRVLSVMVESKKKLSELGNLMTVVPQVLRNVRITKRKKLEDIDGLESLLKKVEKKLSDRGRVFLRFSGTEPLVRILVEGPDRVEIDQAAEELADLLHKELA